MRALRSLVFHVCGFALIFPLTAGAVATRRNRFGENITVAGKKLVLNGVGVREATVFKVDVYVAGLYLASKSDRPEAILASPAPKEIRMQFVRDVSAKDLTKAWREALGRNCAKDCERFAERLGKLNAMMSDIAKGDTMAFTFVGDRVDVAVRGKSQGSIEGADFAQVVLRMWIGNPPNQGLKDGLLGKKS